MKLYRRFMCVLLVLFLLMPLPVMAEESDEEAYLELFSEVPYKEEEIAQAFENDPRLFISVLSKQKYGTMISIVGIGPVKLEENSQAYTQTLLSLAQQNALTQAERRVVRWMLSELGEAYDMWEAGVDYQELFSRCAEMDGALPAYYSQELKEVFYKDPYRFLQEMAHQDVDEQQLAMILMEHIYYGNYDRQEVEKLLQSMDSSGKLNDAQKQMLQQLWAAVDQLIEWFGPLPEPYIEPEPIPEPEPTPEVPEEPTATTGKPKGKLPVWVVPCMVIVAALIAVCFVVVEKEIKKMR